MDEFSERFRAALAARLPGLAGHLRVQPDGSLELRVPAPSGNGELFISTRGEVTIGFGPWHAHYDEVDHWGAGEFHGEPFERAIAFLEHFLRDLLVIQVWTKGGQYAASGPHHWWYGPSSVRADPHGDHYAYLSWSGEQDTPPIPVDPAEFQKWLRQMG